MQYRPIVGSGRRKNYAITRVSKHAKGSWGLLAESFRANPKGKGKGFERVARHYLLNDNVQTNRPNKFVAIWPFFEWPARKNFNFKRELGLDLVGEMEDGTYCAIQAKGYGTEVTVTKKAYDAPAGMILNDRRFSELIVITSSNKMSHPLIESMERLPHGQDFTKTLIKLDDLLASNLTTEKLWPHSVRAIKSSATPAKLDPRPSLEHQIEAIEDILYAFRNTDRSQYISPCATGKTVVGLRIAEQLEVARGADEGHGKRVLIMLPSLALVKQTIKAWHRDRSENFRFIVVCSDKDANGDINNEDRLEMDGRPLSADFSEIGHPVTSDNKKIKEFLRADTKEPRYVFATYHSSGMITEAMKEPLVPDFDLALCDEAHRLAMVRPSGDDTQAFTQILYNENIRVRKRLFMTATRRTYTPRRIKQIEDKGAKVASMDDASLFGHIGHMLSYKEALRRKLLCDYKIIVMQVSNSKVLNEIKSLSKKRTFTDGNDRIAVSSILTQLAVLRSMEQHKIRKVISYHSRLSKAAAFVNGSRITDTEASMSLENIAAKLWQTSPDGAPCKVTGLHINGRTPSKERTLRLEALVNAGDNEAVLISNVNCLGEGVDLPELDAIALADPRDSTIGVIQLLGRVVRRSETNPNKTGYLILPVLVDEAAINKKLSNKAISAGDPFDAVWKVASALRSMDEDLGHHIDIAHETSIADNNETKSEKHSREAKHKRSVAAIAKKFIVGGDPADPIFSIVVKQISAGIIERVSTPRKLAMLPSLQTIKAADPRKIGMSSTLVFENITKTISNMARTATVQGTRRVPYQNDLRDLGLEGFPGDTWWSLNAAFKSGSRGLSSDKGYLSYCSDLKGKDPALDRLWLNIWQKNYIKAPTLNFKLVMDALTKFHEISGGWIQAKSWGPHIDLANYGLNETAVSLNQKIRMGGDGLNCDPAYQLFAASQPSGVKPSLANMNPHSHKSSVNAAAILGMSEIEIDDAIRAIKDTAAEVAIERASCAETHQMI